MDPAVFDQVSALKNSIARHTNWHLYLFANRIDSVERDIMNLTLESYFSDCSDRMRRSNNIIIFNLPEQENFSDPPDATVISELFQFLGLNITPINIVRLGPHDAVKPRPTKVELSYPSLVLDVLKAKFKLRSHSTFGSLRISRDLSINERNYFKKVLTEMNERKERGENDLIIKYFQGVPTIIKQANFSN